jgi:ABC-2 type transport system permease protein
VATLPAAEFTTAPLVVLTAIAAGLVTVGLLGFRQCDLGTT